MENKRHQIMIKRGVETTDVYAMTQAEKLIQLYKPGEPMNSEDEWLR